MVEHYVKQTRSFVNLAVGNSKRYNCKVAGYKSRISLSVVTVYLLVFAIGLFAGDLSTSAAMTIESVVSMMTSVTIAGVGSTILYNCWMAGARGIFVSTGVVGIMMAQAAYMFNLFSPPIVNSMFEIASIISMIILYSVSQNPNQNR